jgi:hypothetical protein
MERLMPNKTRRTDVNRNHECNNQNLDAKIREPRRAVLSGWMNFRGSERSASGNGLCLVLDFKYEVAPPLLIIRCFSISASHHGAHSPVGYHGYVLILFTTIIQPN